MAGRRDYPARRLENVSGQLLCDFGQ
jgi:hypothetical protein